MCANPRLRCSKPELTHVPARGHPKPCCPASGFQLCHSRFQGFPNAPYLIAKVPASGLLFSQRKPAQKQGHHNDREGVPNQLTLLVLCQLLFELKMVRVVPQHPELFISQQPARSICGFDQVVVLVLVRCEPIAISFPPSQCFGIAALNSCR